MPVATRKDFFKALRTHPLREETEFTIMGATAEWPRDRLNEVPGLIKWQPGALGMGLLIVSDEAPAREWLDQRDYWYESKAKLKEALGVVREFTDLEQPHVKLYKGAYTAAGLTSGDKVQWRGETWYVWDFQADDPSPDGVWLVLLSLDRKRTVDVLTTDVIKESKSKLREAVTLYQTGKVDDWGRPIYVDGDGNIYKDIDLGRGDRPNIHTTTPAGEPEIPISSWIISDFRESRKPGRLREITLAPNEPFRHHQLKIAKQTLRYSDAGALIMGGMNKDEARSILQQAGWSDERIAKFEESKLREGSDYASFVARVERASSLEDFDKLEASLTRLWNNGIFTAYEFGRLDALLLRVKDQGKWAG
jgi:hypothetical protein